MRNPRKKSLNILSVSHRYPNRDEVFKGVNENNINISAACLDDIMGDDKYDNEIVSPCPCMVGMLGSCLFIHIIDFNA